MPVPALEVRMFGPLAVVCDGVEVPLGGPKQRAALCLLVGRIGEGVSTDALIDAVWGEHPPSAAVNALQSYLSRLRRVVGGQRLVARGTGYVLLGDGVVRDVDVFDGAVRAARMALAAGDPAAAVRACEAAVATRCGEPLADTWSDWALGERARLNEAFDSLRELEAEALIAAGDPIAAAERLRGMLARPEGLREHAWALLMRALYAQGRQAEALDAYRLVRRRLVDELGIEPGEELRETERLILGQADQLRPAATTAARRVVLPGALSRFVGREDDLAELTGLLSRTDRPRLVTLTGPGGVGKTRLAYQTAQRLLDVFADGVVVVELADLAEHDQVLPTIGAALGVAATAVAPADALRATLVGARLLLILDNFEHLLEAAAPIGRLLASCDELVVLVTSRERLHLAGEHEFIVEPLHPADAVALLNDRTPRRAGQATTTSELANAICRRVDYLPLGVELVAARLKYATPDALLLRLDASLREPGTRTRETPARQQTLHAALAWSHALLTRDEQRLFRRLAVFVGGCTLEAAETVCDANAEMLASLVDKSLLRHDDGRFGMLVTIHQYATALLVAAGEHLDIERRHADWLIPIIKRAQAAERVGAFDEADRLIRHEVENVTVAIARARLRGDRETRLCFASGPRAYLDRVGVEAARRELEALLVDASWHELRDHPLASFHAGFRAVWQGDRPAARRHAETVLRAGLEREDGWIEGRGHTLLGHVYLDAGDTESARLAYEQAAAVFGTAGHASYRAIAQSNCANVALVEGNYEEARRVLEPLAVALPDPDWAAWNLASALLGCGEARRAVEVARDAGSRLLALGRATNIDLGDGIDILAAAYAETHPAIAAAACGQADSGVAAEGVVREQFEARRRGEVEALLRELLGDDSFQHHYDSGRTAPLEQTWAELSALPLPE